MNDPTHPVAAVTPSYDDDIYGWAIGQAGLLRAHRFVGIDWENIAEEIEDVGKSQYDGLESSLRVLLTHILKWEHQPAYRSRSWMLTIREQLRQVDRKIARNPGLKSSLDEIRREAYKQARVAAQTETGLAIEVFPMKALGWNIINNPPVYEDDLPER